MWPWLKMPTQNLLMLLLLPKWIMKIVLPIWSSSSTSATVTTSTSFELASSIKCTKRYGVTDKGNQWMDSVPIKKRNNSFYPRLANYSDIIVNDLQSVALGLFPRGWPFPVLHRAGDDAEQFQDWLLDVQGEPRVDLDAEEELPQLPGQSTRPTMPGIKFF